MSPAHARFLAALAWVAFYLAAAAFPLVVLLLGSPPAGGGRWWDFAMAIGFGGLALLGLQFVLTARFRRATAPFGTDIIYYFHRLAAVGGAGLVLGHYLILRVRYAAALGPANPATAPWELTAGRAALVLFAVVIATSLLRKRLGLAYDRWRFWHGVLASAAVALAIAHIQGVGHYTRMPWKGAVWLGYSAAWLLALAYIRLLRPLQLMGKPYRLVETRPASGNTWTLALEAQDGQNLGFQPGQFAWLTLGASPFRAEEHPFSFSGSAANAKRLEFTVKELGDFTRTIGRIPIGTVAYVDGPHGTFTSDLYPDAAGFVFVAGGVGIAPVMSMLRTMADRGEARPLHLVFGSWRAEDILFRAELESLSGLLPLSVMHVLQAPPVHWPGEVGFLTEAVLRRSIPASASGFEHFLCGPKPMTDLVVPSLRKMGVPLRRIHLEHFEMA